MSKELQNKTEPGFVPSPLATISTNQEISEEFIRQRLVKFEAWQIQAIHSKMDAVKKFKDVHHEMSLVAAFNKKIDDRIEQHCDDLTKLLTENEESAVEYAEFNKFCERFSEMKENLECQIELLNNQVIRNITPKIVHYLNSLGTLTRKIEKTVAAVAVYEEQYALKLKELETGIEESQLTIKDLEKESEQIDQQSNELIAAMAEEDAKVGAVNIQLANAKAINEDIKKNEEIEAQLALKYEAELAAFEDLQNKMTQDERDLQTVYEQIDLKKKQRDAIEVQTKLTEARIEDINWVLSEVQERSAPFDELLSEEDFRCYLFNVDYFKELKANLEMLEDDNKNLAGELNTFIDSEELQKIELCKIGMKTNEYKRKHADVESEIQRINKDQEDLKKELVDINEAVRKANEDSLKEVIKLEAELKKVQEEQQRFQSDKELTVIKLDKALQEEKIKTKKAQESAKASNSRRSSVSSDIGVPVKHTSIKEEQTEIKLEPKSSATQPLSPLQPVVQKTNSPQSQLISNLFCALTTRPPTPPTTRPQLTKENLKRRSATFKENDLPVSLDDTIENSPKRSRFEEEKAFDSDDSTSFNISFNTDIHDFMG